MALIATGAGTADAATDSTLTVGVPNATNNTGAIDNRMRFGGAQVLTEQQLKEATAGVAGTRFGSAVLSGFDLDGFEESDDEDMIVGAAGTPSKNIAGQVYLLLGDVDGFQRLLALESHAQTGDEFGSSLSLSSATGGYGRDLWIGAPGHDVDGKVDAGAVFRYRLDDGVPTFVEMITQDSPLVPGSAEAGDRFGEVMGGAGVVGIPREDIGSQKDAGAVQWLHTDPDTHDLIAADDYNQDRAGIPGIAEAGDRFGAAISADTLIGVPGEDIGKLKDAGVVQRFSGKSFNQDTPGVPGTAEAGDEFGAAVISAPLQCPEMGTSAIGAPGEDIGTVKDAGSVTLLPDRVPVEGEWQYPCPAEVLREGAGDLAGAAEAGDRFGAVLSTIRGVKWAGDEIYNRSTLLIGVPGEDVAAAKDAGRVISREWESLRTFSYASLGFATGDVGGMRYGTVLPSS